MFYDSDNKLFHIEIVCKGTARTRVIATTNYEVYAFLKKILESPARSAMQHASLGHPPFGSWMHPDQVSEIPIFIGGLYSYFLRPLHPDSMGFSLTFLKLRKRPWHQPCGRNFARASTLQPHWIAMLGIQPTFVDSWCFIMKRFFLLLHIIMDLCQGCRRISESLLTSTEDNYVTTIPW